jgi:site-specific DNA-methyltransferase (adenine-specific)
MYEIKQGDCLELMKDIPSKSIDLILCDLPYGTTANKWDAVIPFDKLWEQYKRIIKDNGAILLFSQMPFGANLIMSNPKMFRYEWIWLKPNSNAGFLNCKKMPMRRHENILVFYKHLPTYNPQMISGKPYTDERARGNGSINYNNNTDKIFSTVNEGTRYPSDYIEIKTVPNGKNIHPTQKPVDLLEYLIKTYTNEGDTVLDNCMGSGSTGVACINTNRKFIGMELDEKYFEVAKERLGKVEVA